MKHLGLSIQKSHGREKADTSIKRQRAILFYETGPDKVQTPRSIIPGFTSSRFTCSSSGVSGSPFMWSTVQDEREWAERCRLVLVRVAT